MRVFSVDRYSVWSSTLALHIEIYTASRGFPATARLLSSVLATCDRLSRLLVSFWAYVKYYRIVLYAGNATLSREHRDSSVIATAVHAAVRFLTDAINIRDVSWRYQSSAVLRRFYFVIAPSEWYCVASARPILTFLFLSPLFHVSISVYVIWLSDSNKWWW